LAGDSLDTISNNFRQAGQAFSFDAGENWSSPDPIAPGLFRSDPVLEADTEGNFFYNTLRGSADGFTCDVYKSNVGTDVWDDGVFAYGGDKQWMAIDRTNTPSMAMCMLFGKRASLVVWVGLPALWTTDKVFCPVSNWWTTPSGVRSWSAHPANCMLVGVPTALLWC
jgi:hypothetical protein